jgi:hypothetical protein
VIAKRNYKFCRDVPVFLFRAHEALAYECLPSRSAAFSFLRSTDGAIPGRVVAQKIVLIGAPKDVIRLPLCIADPMGVESCLLVLAELDVSTSEYLVCPGANKRNPGRLAERSSTFHSEGIRATTLSKGQLVPFRDPASSVPKTLQELNERHAWKTAVATAKCIAEIHRAEVEGRQADFGEFVDPYVCGWSQDYAMSGLELVIVWEDSVGRRHASVSPCVSQLVRYCSGATSAVSAAPAALTDHLAASSTSEPAVV